MDSIGQGAFRGCTSLSDITVPDSVAIIGRDAFSGCTRLWSVTIGNGVTSIDAFVFGGCTGLTSVTIGNSVDFIGEGAFFYCTSLVNITIPDSVTIIGGSAFYGCTRLWSVRIGNRMEVIGIYAFANCTNLTRVFFSGDAPSIASSTFNSTGWFTVHFVPGTAGWDFPFANRTKEPTGPTFTSGASASITVGQQFSFTITADSSPTSFTAMGLPSGLSLDPISGKISGVATSIGTYTVILSASNAAGTGSQVLTLTVFLPAPVLTVHAVATVGLPFNYP